MWRVVAPCGLAGAAAGAWGRDRPGRRPWGRWRGRWGRWRRPWRDRPGASAARPLGPPLGRGPGDRPGGMQNARARPGRCEIGSGAPLADLLALEKRAIRLSDLPEIPPAFQGRRASRALPVLFVKIAVGVDAPENAESQNAGRVGRGRRESVACHGSSPSPFGCRNGPAECRAAGEIGSGEAAYTQSQMIAPLAE